LNLPSHIVESQVDRRSSLVVLEAWSWPRGSARTPHEGLGLYGLVGSIWHRSCSRVGTNKWWWISPIVANKVLSLSPNYEKRYHDEYKSTTALYFSWIEAPKRLGLSGLGLALGLSGLGLSGLGLERKVLALALERPKDLGHVVARMCMLCSHSRCHITVLPFLV